MVLVLSIITFGIYMIYWLYITRKELTAKTQGQVKSWPVFVLFTPIIAIVLMVLGYAAMAQVSPSDPTSSDSLYFLLSSVLVLAIIIIPFFWFYKFTKLVSAATPHMSNNLYLFWVLLSLLGVGIIWPVLVQSHLNSANSIPLQQNPGATPTAPTPITPEAPLVSPAPPATNTDTTNT
jgi:hypothetical protein